GGEHAYLARGAFRAERARWKICVATFVAALQAEFAGLRAVPEVLGLRRRLRQGAAWLGHRCGFLRSMSSGAPARGAGDIGHAFRPNLFGVQAAGRYLAVIAGTEGLRLAVTDRRDLAAKHHDARVEIMRMRICGVAGLLAAMDDLETLAAQPRFKGETVHPASPLCLCRREAARDIGRAVRTGVFGVSAPVPHAEGIADAIGVA